MNKQVNFMIKILKQYAKENGEIVRGTTDLSPLQQWLIMQLYKSESEGQVEDIAIRCARLKEELITTDKLLAERQRVLDAIPECKVHGKNCVPNALGWIAQQLQGVPPNG